MKEHSVVVKGREAPRLSELRVWFNNIKDDWIRLRALKAHGRCAKSLNGKFD